MAKTWKKYEVMVLIDSDLGLDTIEGMIERFREIIRNSGGKVQRTVRWGIRTMAFSIKRKPKAYYAVIEFAGEGPVSTNLSHQLNLLDTVIKFQIVKNADGVEPADLPDTEEVVDQVVRSVEEVMPIRTRDEDEEEDMGDEEERD
jgi:small subunit ribosomal protein S6